MNLNSKLSRKKGDFPSTMFIVIIIVVIGIIFMFGNHLNDKIFTEFEDYLENNPDTNNSEALTAIEDIHAADNSVWDYAFLAVVLGSYIILGLTAFSTRISTAFFWLYGILAMIILLTGTILSNIWQSYAANAEFVNTIARFPITNSILGTNYPLVVSGITILVMILLFGKPPGAQQE